MFASPSRAPLILRVGRLSNSKLPVGVSATSLRTHSGTNWPLDSAFSVSYLISVITCRFHSFTAWLQSWLCLCLCVRHRLEEGQASSWSRRLKFFMCCTRAQDTQSVSHGSLLLISSSVKGIWKTRKPELCRVSSTFAVIKIRPCGANQGCDTKRLITQLLPKHVKQFYEIYNVKWFHYKLNQFHSHPSKIVQLNHRHINVGNIAEAQSEEVNKSRQIAFSF